jgi:hypothetical protein
MAVAGSVAAAVQGLESEAEAEWASASASDSAVALVWEAALVWA